MSHGYDACPKCGAAFTWVPIDNSDIVWLECTRCTWCIQKLAHYDTLGGSMPRPPRRQQFATRPRKRRETSATFHGGRFVGLIAAKLFFAGCSAEVAAIPPEPCEVEPVEIQLGLDCWEDPECVVKREADEICGRAYKCFVTSGERAVCVTARDCDCLADVEAECPDTEVYWPEHCR